MSRRIETIDELLKDGGFRIEVSILEKTNLMKYVFVFLLVGLMVSCGNDATGDASTDVTVKEEMKSFYDDATSKPTTVKIGTLEVMTKDLGKMHLDEAKKACAALGDGWRLPTKDELNILYENKEKIGGFSPMYYWSSTGHRSGGAWFQHLSDGRQYGFNRSINLGVRAVRTF